MSQAAIPPRLRLVGTDDPEVVANWPDARAARQKVIRENRAAGLNPSLDPTDPRWVLAVRAYSQLEGSTLTPERRKRVMRTAEQLGMRPFDANMVIAIVQDRARTNEKLSDAHGSLALLRKPTARIRTNRSIWLHWSGAIIAGIVATWLLIRWFLG